MVACQSVTGTCIYDASDDSMQCGQILNRESISYRYIDDKKYISANQQFPQT